MFVLLVIAPVQAETLTVAAASDLQYALPELGRAFTLQSGHRLRTTLSSSGTLAAQIQHGAPFHLFLSADEAYPQRLARAGLAVEPPQVYAEGRLVVWGRHARDIRGGLASLKHLQGRIALANPQHAPYGRAARSALQKSGLWDMLQARLVYGESVSQAATFALTGHADAALIALSQALAAPMQAQGGYVVVPRDMHPPIRQACMIHRQAPAAAHTFAAFLHSKAARTILIRYGFEVPP